MTTQAETFIKEVKDNRDDSSFLNELMTKLDKADIPSIQDWQNEETTWTFDDGSRIRISGYDGLEVVSVSGTYN